MTEYEKVFAVGGSIYTDNIEETPDIAKALTSHSPVAVIVGAGELKKNINAADVSEAGKDLIGIQATRLNARTLGTQMSAYPRIPETAEEIKEISRTNEDIVMGGLNPGFSTDAVAAITAELLDADLYIATDVDGVYTEDPSNESAEKFSEVSITELRDIVSGNGSEAGSYKLIDKVALDIIERSSIKTKIFEGTIDNLEKPETAEGTEIASK